MESTYLTFRPLQSPTLHEFRDPDTGYHYTSDTRANLVKHINTYRAQNELPPILHLNLVLDDYLCRLPCHTGMCRPIDAIARGLSGTLKGGIMLFKALLYDKFVSEEEADRRAEICIKCPYNIVEPKRSLLTRYTDKLALKMIGPKRKTKHDSEIGTCAICTCPLKAKVHYDGCVDLTAGNRAAMRLVDCWQLDLPPCEETRG